MQGLNKTVLRSSKWSPSTTEMSVYSQLWQNNLNNYFRAKVGKELPNFQDSFWSVNCTSVILHSQILQTLCNPVITKKSFQGGSKSVIYYLTNCWNNRSPVRNVGGVDCKLKVWCFCPSFPCHCFHSMSHHYSFSFLLSFLTLTSSHHLLPSCFPHGLNMSKN